MSITTPKKSFDVQSMILNDPNGPIIFSLDWTYSYLFFNEKHAHVMHQIWGKYIKVGISMLDVISDANDRQKAKKNFDRALSGESFRLVEEYGDEHLERHAYEIEYRPLKEKGEIIGLTVWIKNSKFDSETVNQHRRKEQILEQESIGTWDIDLVNNEIYLSGFWKGVFHNNILTISKDTNHILSKIHPEDLRRIEQAYQECLESSQRHFHVNFRVMLHKNDYTWLTCSASIEKEQGRVVRIVGINKDITREKDLEKKWQEEEAMLREVQRISNMGIYEYEFITDEWTSTQQLNKIFGITRNYTKNIDTWKSLIHPDDLDRVVHHLSHHVLEERNLFDLKYRIIDHQSKKEKYVHGKGRLILDEEGNVISLVGTIQDITKDYLREREIKNMSKFAENTLSGLIVTNPKGITTWVHPSMQIISGHSKEEILGKPPGEVLQGPDTDPKHIEAFTKGIASRKPFTQKILNYRKDGSTMWNQVQIIPLFDDKGDLEEFLGVQVDITALVEKEKILAEALKAKDILLKELHHRVKNNLQMVSSILHLRSRVISDEYLKDLVKDINSKILSVAEVHEALLAQEKSEKMHFGSYLRQLTNNIVTTFSGERRHFELDCDISNHKLKSDTVFTLGLAVHEILTNIIKYAYTEQEIIYISISFTKKDRVFQLAIKDNGMGLVGNEHESTGLMLIKTLINSLEGTINIINNQGMQYCISFPD